ncbi:formyltetrahydrofolate deformylase [Desulfonatronovibrio magnus]|uniref:formyltetrahydrofolate deformylase n=1 Tax=Desulfonatronovibrio magnus TaxID=698827 RepID=UPI0005EB76D5|nr:formyltetrahydrofolate deformylase [Desulfonatronovibrio magnus]
MTYHLLIEARDRMGLVHAISGVLYEFGLNIEQNYEYVDKQEVRFFMRTEFSGEIDQERLVKVLQNRLPDISIKLNQKKEKKTVVLVTKEPHCLGDLLIRARYGELDMKIQTVISNHDTLRDLVEGFGIDFHHIPHAGLQREDHEKKILEVIKPYGPDFLVLAKYMRVLSPYFVSRYPERIINIHHSFLPAFIGASPYKQAYDRGVKIIGATAHFVNDELDDGPIITQGVMPVNHTFSASDMSQAGRDIEKQVLAKALKLTFDHRVFIFGRKTIIFE